VMEQAQAQAQVQEPVMTVLQEWAATVPVATASVAKETNKEMIRNGLLRQRHNVQQTLSGAFLRKI
jgi:hypothetical protein